MPPEPTRLGVLGWPVAHSRSPAMQNAALAAVGLSGWRYQLLPVPPALFTETVRALPSAGFRGANATIPHKHAALAAATAPTERARAIGAANTLLFEPDGAIRADNTDAPGLIASLPVPVAGRSALVLGAGGSARAAVWALLDAGAGPVFVWNRTAARAERICSDLGGIPVQDAPPADFLIHCTSSGLDASDRTFKHIPVTADELQRFECVVDFVYTNPAHAGTALVEAARAHAIPVVDGFELLVAQGAIAFEQFTGSPAPAALMRAAARGR
jgi:shikimate dehydrogenase